MAADFGYAGNILKVDLTSGKVERIPTADYSERFIGGRGLAAALYWDEVPPQAGALDAENKLIFTSGPLAGFKGLVGSRWQACGKSPITRPEYFNYTVLGGNWGAQLKFAGYDGLVVGGKSEKPVYLLIEDDKVQIKDASALWGKTTIQAREMLKAELGNAVNVLATGPAGENLVTFGSMLADMDAHGSVGFGAVMGSKKLKAIAVRGSGSPIMAHPERFQELAKYVRESLKGVTLSDTPRMEPTLNLKKDPCWGCIGGCLRKTYQASDGSVGKFCCASGVFYALRARKYYGGWNEAQFWANRLCNEYGVDIFPIDTMMMWLGRCEKEGILNDENTGIPISKQGSMEFVETLVKKIALREGFGDVLARGVLGAAEVVGQRSKELIGDFMIDTGHNTINSSRMYISTGLLYAMEPRQPMHQLSELYGPVREWLDWVGKVEGSYVSTDVLRAIGKRFWGSEQAVYFTTYEGKALAAKMIQDRQNIKESLMLCSYLFPITHVKHSENHVGDPTIESKLYSAVTGKEVEDGLNSVAERIFNVQRAILVREGRGAREGDKLHDWNFTKPLSFELYNPPMLSPTEGDDNACKKGFALDREKFEQLKGEYYALRGWDVATGLQTKAKLNQLGLKDVARDLAKRGLAL